MDFITLPKKLITLQDEFFAGVFKEPYSVLQKNEFLSKLLDKNFLKLLQDKVLRITGSDTVYEDVAKLRDFYESEEDFIKKKVGNNVYENFLSTLDDKESRFLILAFGTLKEMQEKGFYSKKVKLVPKPSY